MAQDFYSAFHLGVDDRHVGSIDEGGVALAAIQGLYQLAKEKDQKIEDLQKQISSLKKQVAAHEDANARWEERFIALEKAVSRKSSPVLTVSNTSENR
jgi:cell division septum initiation protein DivIVA